jgi:hypothetical protein
MAAPKLIDRNIWGTATLQVERQRGKRRHRSPTFLPVLIQSPRSKPSHAIDADGEKKKGLRLHNSRVRVLNHLADRERNISRKVSRKSSNAADFPSRSISYTVIHPFTLVCRGKAIFECHKITLMQLQLEPRPQVLVQQRQSIV